MLRIKTKVLLIVVLITIFFVSYFFINYNSQSDNFINENNIETYIFDNIEYISIKDLCHSFWFNSKYDVKYDGFNQFSLFSKSERKIILKQFEFIEIHKDLYFTKEYFEENVIDLISN